MHLAGRTGAAAVAAERNDADAAAARAATAADALRHDAKGTGAAGRDPTGGGDVHAIGAAADRAAATGPGDALERAAGAATTADALREDAVGITAARR